MNAFTSATNKASELGTSCFLCHLANELESRNPVKTRSCYTNVSPRDRYPGSILDGATSSTGEENAFHFHKHSYKTTSKQRAPKDAVKLVMKEANGENSLSLKKDPPPEKKETAMALYMRHRGNQM